MKFLICLTFLILATCTFAFAQKSEYRIRAKGNQIVVRYKSKAHALNLVDKIDAAKITDTEILFANRKDGFLYLVVNISGQSKAKQDDRQCGAGIESNLIWIKFDSTWKILDSNSVRYESCWSSTTSNDGLQLKGNLMFIEIDDFRKDVNIKLSYDSDKPEVGFQITQKALEKSK
jgi:hypothetical protein